MSEIAKRPPEVELRSEPSIHFHPRDSDGFFYPTRGGDTLVLSGDLVRTWLQAGTVFLVEGEHVARPWLCLGCRGLWVPQRLVEAFWGENWETEGYVRVQVGGSGLG